jgi:hypothetical protein
MDRSGANPPLASAGRIGRVALAFVVTLAVTGPALAFRPFDGTDAAVTDVGELEIGISKAG